MAVCHEELCVAEGIDHDSMLGVWRTFEKDPTQVFQ